MDNDLTTFGAVLAAAGTAAVLLALLGVRFNRLKFGGTELSYENETVGLQQVDPAADVDVDTPVMETTAPAATKNGPVEVEVKEGLGGHLPTVPVAIAHLTDPMREVDPSFLQEYRSARRNSQHSHFLTHILGPAKHPGQKYSVAIRVTPHKGNNSDVKSAFFYFGRAWDNRVFEGRRGADNRFGITTEAYGPFLALCEVEFRDGTRILLDHYCDFDMGGVLQT